MREERRAAMKVIFVGNSGVGKTSLVARQVHQEYEEKVLSTVAPASFISEVAMPSGQSVPLLLWDTAGQERYQAITVPHYREARVALVCYDSGVAYDDNVRDVLKWVGLVKQHASPDCAVIIVATKCDLLIEDADQQMCLNDLGMIAQKAGADRQFITSARTGEGLPELFAAAAALHPMADAPAQPSLEERGDDEAAKTRCC
jgi:small GTP-binding protein